MKELEDLGTASLQYHINSLLLQRLDVFGTTKNIESIEKNIYDKILN